MDNSPLNIGILTFKYGTKRAGKDELAIKVAAKAMGHKAEIFYSKHFQLTFDTNNLGLIYKNKKFKSPDVMIVRPNILYNINMHMSLVKQMQLMGMNLINTSLSIARAKNKLRTAQLLSYAGIAVPKTVVVANANYLDHAIKEMHSFPLIVKLVQGSFGNGVLILESRRSLRAMLDLFVSDKVAPSNDILIQEYVSEAEGKDLRVFVVGGRIVAAMERTAAPGEFRANLNKGGSIGSVILTDEEKLIALRSTELLKLEVAGVDIIRTASGPKILEVNSNPGLTGITAASGVDVAAEIVKFAVEKARENMIQLEISPPRLIAAEELIA